MEECGNTGGDSNVINWQSTHMEIEIRDYVKDDASDIKIIFAEFVEYHSRLDNCFSKIDTHCDKFVEYIETSIGKNSDHVAVAMCNCKIVGYCISKIEHKPPIYPVPTYGYIDNVGVLNEYQKRGIGSCLLNDAINWFKKMMLKESNVLLQRQI